MPSKFYFTLILCIFLSGCETDDSNSESTQVILEPEVETQEYFISTFSEEALEALSSDLVAEYSTVKIQQTLSSSYSLLIESSVEDYEGIQLIYPELNVTDYYTYGQGGEFDEIVEWSRFFVNEEEASQWKSNIDELYYASLNDSVEIPLLDMVLEGTVTKVKTTDSGNLFITVDMDGAGNYFTVFFPDYDSSSSVSGTIYSVVGTSYKYKFIDDYGYVIPLYQLDYINGAFEID